MTQNDMATREPKISNIKFLGKEEKAQEIEFDALKEGWSEYELADGAVIKMKNVVSRVFKLLDRKKEDGSSMYVLEGSAITTTIPPENDQRSDDSAQEK